VAGHLCHVRVVISVQHAGAEPCRSPRHDHLDLLPSAGVVLADRCSLQPSRLTVFIGIILLNGIVKTERHHAVDFPRCGSARARVSSGKTHP